MRFFKNPKYLTLFVFLSFSSICLGASFIFTPFEKQLRDADAAVYGVVKDSTIKKDPQGQVVTRYSLELSWSAGLDRNEDVHPKSFHVVVPGGSWQGVNYQVSGAPRFSEGEEVFLLLNNSQFGHIVSNLSLGKYEVYRKSKHLFLKSTVFPQHPELSKIKLDDVKEMARESFRVVSHYKDHNDKFVHHKPEGVDKARSSGPKREIASVGHSQTKQSPSSGLFWPFVVLVSIAVSRKIFRVRSK